jgi:hypothetical protein
MDSTNLILSLLFGLVGMGFFMYGKSTGQMIPLGAGVLLMICPTFIPNAIAMVIVCLALSVAPFVLREG